MKVLEMYERWEADLILSEEAWAGGLAAYPTLTLELYDKLLECQQARNEVLKQWRTSHD